MLFEKVSSIRVSCKDAEKHRGYVRLLDIRLKISLAARGRWEENGVAAKVGRSLAVSLGFGMSGKISGDRVRREVGNFAIPRDFHNGTDFDRILEGKPLGQELAFETPWNDQIFEFSAGQIRTRRTQEGIDSHAKTLFFPPTFSSLFVAVIFVASLYLSIFSLIRIPLTMY